MSLLKDLFIILERHDKDIKSLTKALLSAHQRVDFLSEAYDKLEKEKEE